MERSLPTYPQVVRALCGAVVTDASQRVDGPTTGYRCKATYSLYPPPLSVSDLAKREVNEICRAVEEFAVIRSKEGYCFYNEHPAFLFEVCGKVTRKGESMAKIVFLNAESGVTNATEKERSTLFSRWYDHSEEPQLLYHFLKSRIPSLACVVAHVRLTAPHLSLKPDKTCAYLPICATVEGRATAPMQVIEHTPNEVPFLLSADSFCEVNHRMEDAIFRAIAEFLNLADGLPSKTRRAFISGRDVNSVVKTFQSYYSNLTVATSCPQVHADTTINGIDNAHLVRKDAICHLLRDTFSASLDSATCLESHVLITAGRHGLHPSTTAALLEIAEQNSVMKGTGLSDIIYVSCNVDSFSRDLFVLKQGLRVEHVRTFDFFPGTEYTMSVVHLQPLRGDNSGLLLLPVGPPGVGKSTCGRALNAFFGHAHSGPESAADIPFCSVQAMSSLNHGRARKSRENQHVSLAVPSTPASVPRTYADLSANIDFTLFERDRVFHNLRNEGRSLRATKVTAHDALLSVLDLPHRCSARADTNDTLKKQHVDRTSSLRTASSFVRTLVYVDTTNGDAGAREVYRKRFAGPSHATSPVVTVWFCCPRIGGDSAGEEDEAELLDRVSRRVNHPCFPETTEAQAAKLSVIRQAIQPPTSAERDSKTVVHVDAALNETYTILQSLVYTAALLHFSTPLAMVYAPLAIEVLAKTEKQKEKSV